MELEKYGFVQAGEWILSRDVDSGIDFKLAKLENDRVVYAFVVADKPKYVGICDKDTTTLQDRLDRYKSRKGRGRKSEGGENTNQRNARLIKEHLETGRHVLIFALKPGPSCEFIDLKVDLVKGLENPLIDKFKPEWNRQKTL